jgi:hypothetical protein
MMLSESEIKDLNFFSHFGPIYTEMGSFLKLFGGFSILFMYAESTFFIKIGKKEK